MKGRKRLLLEGALCLALAAALFVAIGARAQIRRSEQALEDCYTQRLLEAQEHLQAIAIKLDKVPAAGGAQTCVELLAGVSRQADGVVADLTALPLSHAAMSDTVKFCNQLSEYTMELALHCASGQGLSDGAFEMLRQLGTQCTLLLGQLETARGTMLARSLHLSLREGVFYASAEAEARPLEQVADPEHGMDYPAMIYDGAFSDARRRGEPKALSLRRVDAEEAVEIARQFVGAQRVQTAEQGVETAGPLAAYGVRLALRDGTVLHAGVTRQGGSVLWMMPEHAAFEPALTLQECADRAGAFLRSHGYGEMEANHFQVYDGLAVINFVAVQEGVLLYPDLVKVQLRMDTGELVGLESNNYLMNHTQRERLAPAVSQEEALGKISPRLSVRDVRLCVIPYRDGERLCWEIAGDYDEKEYRSYVDAESGREIEVLLMIHSEEGELAA